MGIETKNSNSKSILSFVKRRATGLFGVYRGLPKPLYTLFAVTIVNSVGIFVFPFMTLYLTGRLRMTQSQAGNFMLLISLLYIPGNFIGGKIADKFGRKRLMVISQIISAALFIPCGFIGLAKFVPYFILASVFFDGITDPARSAMMMDLTTPENRRTAFSLTYLGHNIGFAVGSLIAGFLYENASSWLFWGNAIAIFMATTIVGLKVPETKPTQQQIDATIGTGSSEEAHKGTVVEALLSRPFLIIFTMITTWYGFVYAQHRFALPLQAKATFGIPGPAIFGSLMTLNAALVIFLSTPVMALTRKWKPINSVALAGVFYALGFGMMGFARNLLLVYASTILWTLGEIVNATNEGAYVANHTPISHRGRFQAVLPLIGGLGWMISPPVIGALIDNKGLGKVWPLVGVIAGTAAFLLWILGKVEAWVARTRSKEVVELAK